MKPSKLRYYFYGGRQLDPELRALFRRIKAQRLRNAARDVPSGDAGAPLGSRSRASPVAELACESNLDPLYGDERTLDQLRTLTELAALLSRLGSEERDVRPNGRVC